MEANFGLSFDRLILTLVEELNVVLVDEEPNIVLMNLSLTHLPFLLTLHLSMRTSSFNLISGPKKCLLYKTTWTEFRSVSRRFNTTSGRELSFYLQMKTFFQA